MIDNDSSNRLNSGIMRKPFLAPSPPEVGLPKTVAGGAGAVKQRFAGSSIRLPRFPLLALAVAACLFAFFSGCGVDGQSGNSDADEAVMRENLLEGLDTLPLRRAYLVLLDRIEAKPLDELSLLAKSFLSAPAADRTLLAGLAGNALLLRWHDLAPAKTVDFLTGEWEPATGSEDDASLKLFLIHRQSPERLTAFLRHQPEEEASRLAMQALAFLLPDAPGHEELSRLAGLATRPPERSQWSAQMAEVYQWAESDPDAAVEAIRTMLDDPRQLQQVAHLLPGLAASRPEATGRLAIEIATRYPDQTHLAKEAVASWVLSDPDAALPAIRGIARFQTRSEFFRAGYAAWSELDPETAVPHAFETIQASGLRFSIVPELLGNWMRADPEAASQYVEQLPDHAMNLYSEVYRPWAERDPQAAFEHFAGLAETRRPLRSSNSKSYERLMEVWMRNDRAGALQWIRGREPGRIKDLLLRAAAKQLPPQETIRNLNLILEIENMSFREEAAAELVAEIAGDNPMEGLQLIDQMADRIEKSPLLESVFRVWAQTDPAAAAEHFPHEAGVLEQKAVAKTIGDAYYDNDREAALAWMGGLPGHLQAEVYNGIAQDLRRRPGGSAAARFLDSIGEGRAKDYTYAHAAWTWAQSDPDGAMRWSLERLEGEVRDQAIHSTVSQMLNFDPDTALAWIERPDLPPVDRDEIVVGASLYYVHEDPHAAALWIAEIEQTGKRLFPLNRLKQYTNAEQREAIKNSVKNDPKLTNANKQWLLENL